jgi:hypothetical protein
MLTENLLHQHSSTRCLGAFKQLDTPFPLLLKYLALPLDFSSTTFSLNLGCLHPVACVRDEVMGVLGGFYSVHTTSLS